MQEKINTEYLKIGNILREQKSIVRGEAGNDWKTNFYLDPSVGSEDWALSSKLIKLGSNLCNYIFRALAQEQVRIR